MIILCFMNFVEVSLNKNRYFQLFLCLTVFQAKVVKQKYSIEIIKTKIFVFLKKKGQEIRQYGQIFR